ncbi:hypothetical protein FACS189419_06730 [Planctomycetales bacterium]|nr:hypothetical protein FACS189419_06730 [Planctomycetales bacterium]
MLWNIGKIGVMFYYAKVHYVATPHFASKSGTCSETERPDEIFSETERPDEIFSETERPDEIFSGAERPCC